MPAAVELRAPSRKSGTSVRPALSPQQELCCLGSAALAFGAVFLLLGVRYEVNDDALISCIAAGAYGGDRVRLCYVNILIGWALAPFYSLTQSINWYVVFSVAGLFVCAVELARCAVRKLGTFPGLCLWWAGMLLLGVDAVHAFQYTKNAALFTLTGWLVLTHCAGQPRRGAALGGTLLVLAGACLRWQSFAVVTAMAAPLLALTLLRLPAGTRKKPLTLFAAVLALCLAAWGINEAAYRLDDGWNTWRAYNTARTEISDHRLQYITAEDASGYGLTENDYSMLESWDYGDTALYPLEELQALAAALPHRTLRNAVRETLLTLPDWVLTTLPGWALTAALLAWLTGRQDRSTFAAGLATLAVFLAGAYALVYGGRTPWRTVYLLLAPCAVLLLAIWQPRAPAGRRLAAAALAFCAAVSFAPLRQTWTGARQFREDHRPGNAKEEAIRELISDKEHTYVVSTSLEDDLAGKDVWHTRPAGAFDHITFLGGWASQSPLYAGPLRAADLDPAAPLVDAVDQPDVRYVDFCCVDDKLTALSQRGGIEVQAEEVSACLWWTVYRLVQK